MTFVAFLMLMLVIAMEVAREICFKLAANQSNQKIKSGGYLMRVFQAPFVWLGFFCWGVELFAWIKVLSSVSLSIAFPLMSLCYCGLIFASRYILKEQVSRRKWIGVALITFGVAIIGSQGMG